MGTIIHSIGTSDNRRYAAFCLSISPCARNSAGRSSLNRRISNSAATIARFTCSIRRCSDVALNTRSIPTAVSSETAESPTIGGSCRKGNSRRSKAEASNAFKIVTALRNVPEPFQLFLDLGFAVALLDRRDLFLEHVRDELVDRRIAGDVGTALHLGQQRLIEFDARSKHSEPFCLSSLSDPAHFVLGKPSMPNSARIAAARVCRLGAAFRSVRLVSRMPGTPAGSIQWSPFHASRLSTIVSGVRPPSADTSELRVPFAYPTIASGAMSSCPLTVYTSSRRNIREIAGAPVAGSIVLNSLSDTSLISASRSSGATMPYRSRPLTFTYKPLRPTA